MSDPRPGSTGGEGGARDRAASDRSAGEHADASRASTCPVAFCPICAAVSAANRSAPEVVEHLLLAGQQFLLALRAVVDARAADFEGREDERAPSMERIDIG